MVCVPPPDEGIVTPFRLSSRRCTFATSRPMPRSPRIRGTERTSNARRLPLRMLIARCNPSLPDAPFPYEQLKHLQFRREVPRNGPSRRLSAPWSGSVKRNDLADTCAVVPATRSEVNCASLATNNIEGAKRTPRCGFLHLRMSGEDRCKLLILIGVPDGI